MTAEEPPSTKNSSHHREKADSGDSRADLEVGLLAAGPPGQRGNQGEIVQSIAELIINSSSDFM